MKYYQAFLKMGCFSFDEVKQMTGGTDSAAALLHLYLSKGYIAKVRRGLYVAINLLDQEPVANKFVIASHLSDTAVVSHHSAFEYYGYANQVSYDMSVTSDSKFNGFSFGGFHYHRMTPHISSGVSKTSSGVAVTDVERTVLDSINDFERNMGFEELIQCLSVIPVLNEKKLLRYLAEYNKCFLYQKAGYILEHFKDEFAISDAFLAVCKKESSTSSRYLMKDIPKDRMDFNNRWHLTVPADLWQNTLYGGDEDADV